MRATGRELIDGPVESRSELEGSLRDIEAANRWLGGAAPVRRKIRSWRAQRVLDVGTGSADIPRALLADARADHRVLRITCVDSNPQMIEVARGRSGGERDLTFELGDGVSLPFADASFDVAMSNLTLHHIDPEPAVDFLAELARVGRRPLVTDLYRSPGTHAGAWLFSRLVSSNRLTRNDAPLSARRAYTCAEALALARRAGWRNPTIHRTPFFRMVLFDV
ncbi:MAG: methyltransferase domain-containing protein [Candidatus Eremiobacteraeota bacterium]|nr:methyltransferase domain-containing protein [Candidatus Eremiobacteraeota bacterium]